MNTKTSGTDYLQECKIALDTEQAQSLAETDNWSHVDKRKVHLDWDALYKELAPLLERLQPSSPEIQAIMARHYAIVSRFYAPSHRAYIGMSLFYRDNQDMKAFHNAYHPNMVDFLAEAMPIYAHKNLEHRA
ncbi:MAG: TipAS antibiotic-recognition domain-containing protein [Burkholderiaceae bacterium]|nr:TipAS antibiotic-recognition domain-containing protein [Burkholderiaceae bacterium]